jgi:hypothetical protein
MRLHPSPIWVKSTYYRNATSLSPPAQGADSDNALCLAPASHAQDIA